MRKAIKAAAAKNLVAVVVAGRRTVGLADVDQPRTV